MVLSLNRWIGQLAVVTGASAGIGAAIVERLLDAGINVVGLARRLDKLSDLSNRFCNKNAKFYPIKCDITNEEEVKCAFEEIKKLGAIYILINNAGVTANASLHNGEVNDFKKILDTNVLAVCIVTKLAIKQMTEQQTAGQIININSILGHYFYDIPQMSLYSASKHALTALTDTLRLELIHLDSDIKVTSLSPGPVESTEFGLTKSSEHMTDLLTPDEVADGVILVLSTPPHLLVAEIMLRPLKQTV